MSIILEKPREIAEDHFLLRIEHSGIRSCPGQFVNIRISRNTDPLLRRPFSIHNQQDDLIEIVFRVVGKGTGLMKDGFVPGDADILAPLGKGFTLAENCRVLIAGGGVGNAPLLYLAKKLREKNNHITYIYGVQTSAYIYLEDKYREFADDFILATDDGSSGLKGYVSDVAEEAVRSQSFDRIYTCGPTVMMSKIIKLAEKKTITAEVSVENYFGCGFGVCYGCTIETDKGLKRVCVEGPVFNGRSIKWEI